MRAQQLRWSSTAGWSSNDKPINDAQLVLFFASRMHFEHTQSYSQLQDLFPASQIVGCSTGGQIADSDITDESAVALAMHFERTALRVSSEAISDNSESFLVGKKLGASLSQQDLRSVLVISDGLRVNGSRLIEGLRSSVGKNVIITGGLAGDGADFAKTIVAADKTPSEGQVVAVGFYGSSVIVGHGSAGGWDTFGPKRLITKSEGSILHRLDDKPALDLYKSYLGDEAEGLPGTALLYPLLITDPDNHEHKIVRTVLAVDHETATMTFAGDMPEGWTAQLMRGYFDNLSKGASEAAQMASIEGRAPNSDTAAILISCIGRRLLMGESIIDEIEAASTALGPEAKYIGFYSYGEISPHSVSGYCELHNQTMTVTTITEAA